MTASASYGIRAAAAEARALAALAARIGAAMLVFLLSSMLFLIAIAFAAYRIPAFQDRQVLEGRVQWRKIEMENRTVFENLAANRNIVRLDGETVVYLPVAGNEKFWHGNGLYQATVSAKPLLFGGYGDAQLITVVLADGTALPAPAD